MHQETELNKQKLSIDEDLAEIAKVKQVLDDAFIAGQLLSREDAKRIVEGQRLREGLTFQESHAKKLQAR